MHADTDSDSKSRHVQFMQCSLGYTNEALLEATGLRSLMFMSMSYMIPLLAWSAFAARDRRETPVTGECC